MHQDESELRVERAIFLGGKLDWKDLVLPLAEELVHDGEKYLLGSWTDDASGFTVPCYALSGMRLKDIEDKVEALLWAMTEIPDEIEGPENRFWLAKGMADAWETFRESLADVIVENSMRLKEEKEQWPLPSRFSC